jgi:hypothetical protein
MSSTLLYREAKGAKTITPSLDEYIFFCIDLCLLRFFELGEIYFTALCLDYFTLFFFPERFFMSFFYRSLIENFYFILRTG